MLAGQGCCQPKALLITWEGDTIISFSCTSQGYVSNSGFFFFFFFHHKLCIYTFSRASRFCALFQELTPTSPSVSRRRRRIQRWSEQAGHGTLLVIDQWRREGSTSLFSEGLLSLLHWFLHQPVVGNCFWASGQTEVFSQMLISSFFFVFFLTQWLRSSSNPAANCVNTNLNKQRQNGTSFRFCYNFKFTVTLEHVRALKKMSELPWYITFIH